MSGGVPIWNINVNVNPNGKYSHTCGLCAYSSKEVLEKLNSIIDGKDEYVLICKKNFGSDPAKTSEYKVYITHNIRFNLISLCADWITIANAIEKMETYQLNEAY